MAITKEIVIDVETGNAVQGFGNLNKAIAESDKQTQSLKSQIKEANIELINAQKEFGDYSTAAINAAKKVAALKDQIQEARETSQLFDPGAKFQAATGAIAAGANAVQGYQAALGLLGVEGEKAQETLLKVQSAMALSQALSSVADSAKDFKRLGAVAKQALSGIRAGIAATGIGLLVVALGTIVAYWDDIKGAVSGVSSEQEKLNSQAQANLDIQETKLDAIGGQENILKLQGKSEKEILKLKLAQTDQVIKASEIQIQQSIVTAKAQTDAAKRNQAILAGVLKFIAAPLTVILKAVDAVGKAFGEDFGLEDSLFDSMSSLIFDPKETQAEGDKVVAEQKKALDKLKNDRAGMQISINNIDKAANTDASNKRKDANDKAAEAAKLAKEKEIELAKEKADALERIRLAEIGTEAELRAEELKQIQDQYTNLIAEATKYNQDTTGLKEAQRTKENELAAKFALEDSERKKAADDKKKADDDKRIAEAKALNDMLIQAEVDLQAAKRGALDQGLNMLMQFAGKNKAVALGILAVQKGLAIADVVVNASKSIATQIGSNAAANKLIALKYAAIPGGGALAGLEIAAGKAMLTKGIATTKISAATNIASIVAAGISGAKSITGSAGGGGAAGGGSAPSGGGSVSAPQFNVIGTSGQNQIAQTLGQQQPIQAYVVSGNVSTAQSLDRNIIQNASI